MSLFFRLSFAAAPRVCLGLILLISFRLSPVLAREAAPGDLVAAQRVGAFSRARLDEALNREAAQLTPRAGRYRWPAAANDVILYRVIYLTENPDNHDSREKASGLLAIPDLPGRAFPVLSWQHSTDLAKKLVPSNPDSSLEARLVVAAFAGQGYAVFMADYLGKGVSPGMHPYLLPAGEACACFDMLRAGRTLAARLGVKLLPRLYLSGWSQGGQATLALLRLLEELGDTSIAGAAPIAGLYDMYQVWRIWLTRPHSPLIPALMLNTLAAYEKFQGIDGLYRHAVRPEHREMAERAKRLFDTESGALTISMTPRNSVELFTEKFMREADLGRTPFYRALRENEVCMWRPLSPVRFYYGEADDIVPADVTLTAAAYMRSLGATVTEADAGREAGHREAFLFALQDARRWFEEQQ